MQIEYNGNVIDVKRGTPVIKLLKSEIERAEKPVIACRFNNEVKPLNHVINTNGEIELIDISTKDGMRIYTRGLIYLIGKAFNELYPKALLTVNYQLSNAMFCQIENMKVTEEMIDKVNKRLKEIVKLDLPIERKSMTRDEAIEFYKKERTVKGKLQLDIEHDKNILLYYCEKYYNYFYGAMPLSTGIINVFEVKKYKEGFLVRYPSRDDVTKLQPFQESKKLLTTLQEYDDLHKILDVHTVYKLNKKVREHKIIEHILLDEALHEKKIANIADEVLKRKKVKMVLIAGPSSSGKTTFAKRLGLQLRLNGIKPVTISVDNYFVEREDTPKDEFGNYDFECIEAIDTELLNKHLISLLNGEEIELPTFDFKEGTKKYLGNKLKLKEDEVIVMEGIHCLNDKLTPLISKEEKFKVYISDLTVLNVDYYNRISTTDTRLIRRIVRDNQFRNYKALHTLRMWYSVNRGEQKNIFPYQEEADVMFNSSLVYELAVFKDIAIPLLEEITPEVPEYREAQRLIMLLKYFEPMDGTQIPNNSLIKEFIGGSIFE